MILASFTETPFFEYIIAIHACLLVVILFIRTSGFVKYMYSFFFLIALILTFQYSIPFHKAVENLAAHAIFIALFVCTPILKIPIKIGNYLEKIHSIIHTTPHKWLHPIIAIQNFILCSFLNFGATQVVDEIFREEMKNQQKSYAQILSRSFSLGALWTPYFGAFSVAVAYSHANPTMIIILGFLICVLTLGFWLIPRILLSKGKKSMQVGFKKEIRNLAPLLLFFTFLIISVMMGSFLTNLSVVVIITIVSVLYSMLWCIGLRKTGAFYLSLKSFIREEVPLVRHEAFLFISIGFFSNTIIDLGWRFHLPEIGTLSIFQLFLFVVLFNLIIILIALTGVHHLVTITLITSMVNWQNLGIHPVVFALMILLAWALSAMLSPFAPSNLLISRITKLLPIQVGLQANWIFAAILLLGSAVYLTIINQLIL